MAEKREGQDITPNQRPPTLEESTVFETPDYRVVVAKMSKGPEDVPAELLLRYVIQHKKHGIIYGTGNGYGQAVVAALQAQAELVKANEIAAEQKARDFKVDESAGNVGPGINFPKLP